MESVTSISYTVIQVDVEIIAGAVVVEVKGEDKLKDPDVIAKKERGVQYCAVASRWGKANGFDVYVGDDLVQAVLNGKELEL